jgi:hypothetical protein
MTLFDFLMYCLEKFWTIAILDIAVLVVVVFVLLALVEIVLHNLIVTAITTYFKLKAVSSALQRDIPDSYKGDSHAKINFPIGESGTTTS